MCNWDISQIGFRIKPEGKRTVGYRRYIAEGDVLSGWGNKYLVKLLYQGSAGEENLNDGIKPFDFIRWLDEDWVYEEV